ncbi:MAG: M15 family metallopeptidase [Bdellovibrionota bacterium]
METKSEVLKNIYLELGITPAHLSANRLNLSPQANFEDLKVVDLDIQGRPFALTNASAKAWLEMKSAAAADHILINPASGFRSYIYQKKIIQGLIAKGRSIENVLTSLAIPGYSEHHTGRAIDIYKAEEIPESEFHNTDSYSWLLENAGRFGFTLSYPQNNDRGIIFEPWHWLFAP